MLKLANLNLLSYDHQVLKMSDTPRNVCLCQYHENVNLHLQCLHKGSARCLLYISAFCEMCVCDAKAYNCMADNELGHQFCIKSFWGRATEAGPMAMVGDCRRKNGKSH